MTAAAKIEEPVPFLTWDTCDITQARADQLREEDETLDEEEAWNQASSDPFLLECEWDFLIESLTDKLREINPDGYWQCEAENLGWQHRSGHKTFKTDEGQAFLQALLPDTDCTFRIYVEGEGDKQSIRIVNSHHDAMGEVYEVRPEDKAPCGCPESECQPYTYHEQRFCNFCNNELPKGYGEDN